MKLNTNANPFIDEPGPWAAPSCRQLQALFRPCAMMVPDYALIGEIASTRLGSRSH